MDIDEDNDTESEDEATTSDDENEEKVPRFNKINCTKGTVEALKTAKELGVMKRNVMKLDYYIEKDNKIEGLEDVKKEADDKKDDDVLGSIDTQDEGGEAEEEQIQEIENEPNSFSDEEGWPLPPPKTKEEEA